MGKKIIRTSLDLGGHVVICQKAFRYYGDWQGDLKGTYLNSKK